MSLGIDPYDLTTPMADITFVLQRQSGDDKKEIETESRFIGKM